MGGAATGGATGAGGMIADAGATDGAANTGGSTPPAPVQPPEPFATLNQCPPDPPIPDGGTLQCPPNPADIANWFPVTPPMPQGGGCQPPPHPNGECLFYVQSWHEFFIALQPDANGKATFLSWNTIENTFGAGAGTPTPAIPVLTAGVTQAGGRQVVVNAPHATDPDRRTGISPADLLLVAAGTCSAWDVVEILRKQRQEVPDGSIMRRPQVVQVDRDVVELMEHQDPAQ